MSQKLKYEQSPKSKDEIWTKNILEICKTNSSKDTLDRSRDEIKQSQAHLTYYPTRWALFCPMGSFQARIKLILSSLELNRYTRDLNFTTRKFGTKCQIYAPLLRLLTNRWLLICPICFNQIFYHELDVLVHKRYMVYFLCLL